MHERRRTHALEGNFWGSPEKLSFLRPSPSHRHATPRRLGTYTSLPRSASLPQDPPLDPKQTNKSIHRTWTRSSRPPPRRRPTATAPADGATTRSRTSARSPLPSRPTSSSYVPRSRFSLFLVVGARFRNSGGGGGGIGCDERQ
jgi:hypothetical protein